MAESNTKLIASEEERRSYMNHLLSDIEAFEQMLSSDIFEKDVKRIGAEQEMVFVDNAYRPAFIGPEINQALNKDFITTEYARFNIEVNADPIPFRGRCLSEMKKNLADKIHLVVEEAKKYDAEILFTGILPTIRKSDTTIDSITPEPRYRALLESVNFQRGRRYEFNIKGLDELISRDNPSTFGGCMTSLQIHLQTDVDNIIDQYNWAQLIAAPTLACATYSPLFLGKRLWHETRIALLKQTTDTRKPYSNTKNEEARVSFGNAWINDSIVEIYHDDIATYKAHLTKDMHEQPKEVLEAGQVPKLEALCFHNGTVYRWNRVCYGSTEGKPHLRIENRVLPAGPTLEDEIANAAFWLGLMNGMPERYKNLQQKMPFDEVKNNFLKAARLGIEVQFQWLDEKMVSAQELILEELLPIAHAGLEAAGIDAEEAKHYLGIIEQRTRSGHTGSRWILNSYNHLIPNSTPDEAMIAITAGMLERQKQDIPVHNWTLADAREAGSWKNRFWHVEQIMTSTLYTVEEDDIVNFATHIMTWKNIGHIPVEKNGKLTGLITKDSIIAYTASHQGEDMSQLAVKEIMLKELITATPDMQVLEAIQLIIKNSISCLPVVEKGKLVGIVTEHDFVRVSHHLYQELLKNSNASDQK